MPGQKLVRDPGHELRHGLQLLELRDQRVGPERLLGLDPDQHGQPHVVQITYPWADVTSSGAIADGDYPMTLTATRTGTSGETSSSFTSYYKIYSSDTTAPTMFWPSPAPGQTISGRSFDVVVSATDDHTVKKIELFMDRAYMSSTACENIAYTCELNYRWQVGAPGQHTARFEATDWMGNVGVETVRP